MVALRELGYPVLEKLDVEVVKELILHDWGTTHLDMLQRITRSWEMVHTKGSEVGRNNFIAK